MEVVNKLIPNDEQLQGFLDPDATGPICMVNLLKFRERAEYEDGRETTLSGAEAYALYTKGVVNCLKKVGGYLGFGGQINRLMLGEVEEMWDTVALAVYPSRQAMLQMMHSGPTPPYIRRWMPALMLRGQVPGCVTSGLRCPG